MKKNIFRMILFTISGTLILTFLSVLQKLLLGVNPFNLIGYLVSISGGGALGFFIGLYCINNNKKRIILVKDLENIKKEFSNVEEIARLGVLVSGLAHELNTPLGVSITSITCLIDNTTEILTEINKNNIDISKIKKYLDKTLVLEELILNSSRTISDDVKSFKKLSSPSNNIQILKLSDEIQYVILEIGLDLDIKDFKFNIDILDDIQIECSHEDIYQIFYQLISNSFHHAFTDKYPKKIIDIQVRKQNSKVILVYRDNGIGILENDMNKIFIPFFTTKRRLGCLGIGLNIVYNKVINHLNGHIEIESKKGLKVTMTI